MPPPALIDVHDAQAKIEDMLASMIDSDGFNRASFAGGHARIVHSSRAADGRTSQVTVRLQVQEHHTNGLGTLHGGCAATLVDSVTSLPVLFHTSGELGAPWSFLGVTTSLNCTYLTGSPVHSWIDVVAKVESIGRTLAVIACEIWDVPDGKHGTSHGAKRLTATHTKFDNSGAMKKSKL